LSRFHEPRHVLGPRRNHRPGAPRVKFERRDAGSQSPHGVKVRRQRRLAAVIFAAEMPRQGAIVDLLMNEAFAQEPVERRNGLGGRVDAAQQPFGRKSLRGEKGDLGRKRLRGEIGPLVVAQQGPAKGAAPAIARRQPGNLAMLLRDPRHRDSLFDEPTRRRPCVQRLKFARFGQPARDIRHQFRVVVSRNFAGLHRPAPHSAKEPSSSTGAQSFARST
jgi:hypothetical protein